MLPVSFGTHAIRLIFTVTRSNNFQIPLDYLSHLESISPKIIQLINHHSAITTRLCREDVHQQIEVEVFMLNVTANGRSESESVYEAWSCSHTKAGDCMISCNSNRRSSDIFVTAHQIHIPCMKSGSNIWYSEMRTKRGGEQSLPHVKHVFLSYIWGWCKRDCIEDDERALGERSLPLLITLNV